MRISALPLNLVLLSMFLAADPVAGAAGDLDPSFGDGGKVLTKFLPIGGGAGALVIQPDGKIVAGGIDPGSNSFALVRYLPDGSLDPSFGSVGKVMTMFSGLRAEVTALALQSDGRIVAAGSAFGGGESDFALARYEADGSLDASFGSGGQVTTNFGAFDQAYGAALLPDGRIVAVGSTDRGEGDVDFAVALYETDGALDTSFGTGGRVQTDFFGRGDAAQAVVVQPDGRMIAVGYAFPAGATRVALARYTLDGSLDASFSGDGKATSSASVLQSELGFAAALQPDGRIVVAGTRFTGASFDFLAERYLSDGSPDPGFGTGGWATLDFFGWQEEAHAVALQPDGGIVAAGFAQTGPDFANADFALARYTSAGNLDAGFGTAGRVTTDFFAGADQGEAAASQPDGRIIVAGFATDPDRLQQFALARYLGAVNAPPAITGKGVSRPLLWPPNHKMIDVTVFYQVSDDQDPAPSCTLSVTSNEPVNGTGDGDTSPDWDVLDTHRVRLRSERSGRGSGRIYTIVIACTDKAGASTREAVTVIVPASQGSR